VRASKKWQISAATTVLTVGMMVSGCGTGSTNGNEGGSKPTAGNPIKIGVVTSLSGAIAEYGVEWQRGFKIGLEYATNGSNEVNGHKLDVTFKDDAGDPNVAVNDAKELLQTDKVDILAGAASSASAIAVEPLAQRFKSVFVVGPAVADSITGKNYNPYVFKVSPNSYMEAKAAVEAIQGDGVTVAQLAPNYAFGWDSVKAFKQLSEQAGMKDVLDVYADAKATDFTPQLEKIIQSHPKYLFVTWAGAPGPWKAIDDMKLQQQGITVVTGIPNIAAIKALFKGFSGMRGFTTYYYTLPNNDANTYLVQHDQSEYNTVPDLFDPDGMAAAISIVEGLKKTNGNPNGDKLSAAMAGMTFNGPKGTYTFRAEDHQALQDQFGVVLKDQPGVDYPVPTLTKVLSAQDTVPPILNK
jgi:branched-chain amino acid transport system substrate-binding protein